MHLYHVRRSSSTVFISWLPASVCLLFSTGHAEVSHQNQFYVGGNKIDDMGNKSNKSKSRKYVTSKHLTEQRGTAGFIFTLYSVHVHRIMFYCQTGADLQGSKEGLGLPQLPPSPKKIKYVLNILVFANYFFVQKLCFLRRFTFTVHLHITDFHMLT